MLPFEFIWVDDEPSLLLGRVGTEAEGGGVVGATPAEIAGRVGGSYA